jgi:hypothetical protein
MNRGGVKMTTCMPIEQAKVKVAQYMRKGYH